MKRREGPGLPCLGILTKSAFDARKLAPVKPHKARRRRSSGSPTAQAYRILERWVREELGEVADDPGAEATLELRFKLPIQLRHHRRDRQEKRFCHDLERELSVVKDRLELDRLGYLDGHLYCHWCTSAICEHTLPPDGRAVFVGYETTGQPRWKDFSSWMVERRDPRVERIFLDRPIPIAVALRGPELVADMIQDFRDSRGL